MGDEVTKKDLQSLQGYCNKQIADAEKRANAKLQSTIEAINKSLAGLVTSTNEQEKDTRDWVKKELDSLRAEHNKLVATVAQHASVINENAKRDLI
jgi:hypothetical protein